MSGGPYQGSVTRVAAYLIRQAAGLDDNEPVTLELGAEQVRKMAQDAGKERDSLHGQLKTALTIIRNHDAGTISNFRGQEMIKKIDVVNDVFGPLKEGPSSSTNQKRFETAICILRDIEWVIDHCSNMCRRSDNIFCSCEMHCPECEMAKTKGHAGDCRLAEVLK